MTVRALTKQAIGWAALAPVIVTRTRSSLAKRVNVAYLHYIGERTPFYDDFYCGSTLERFDSNLALLSRHFEFCSLREVLTEPDPTSVGRPRLAVTFDDGFDLIGSGVADALEHYGVSATTFIVTSTIDNADLMWRNKLGAICSLCSPALYLAEYNDLMREHRLPTISKADQMMQASERWPMESKDSLSDQLWERCGPVSLESFLAEHRPYFTWEGLQKWLARGHEVGLHTATHPYCNRIRADAIEDEIVRPAALLRSRLQLGFMPFSYPFGERLPSAHEQKLYEHDVFDCAFGIQGFARRGTPPYRLERAPIEREVRFPVFGKALLARPA